MTADRFLRLWELPLLVKELNEQASRPRTYVIRFLYATTLFVAACALFYGNFQGSGEASVGTMGRGRFMFERLVTCQFWSIYLFLPAISCGALTVEKERNTLGLLLITSLRPWQIILQKILGRVIPMLTFVLLSFPLMAVAYSFGGVTEDALWSGTYLLVLTCVQVGALAIACSAYFPTTVEAFVANYVLFILLFSMFPAAWGPHLFEQASEVPFATTVASSLLLVIVSGVFLIAGWLSVEARAFVPPKNALLGLFKRLDALFNDMNRVTGGIVLVRDGDPLPREEPIAWRETAKKSLGTFRYLFRVLVVIEVPLLFICASLRLSGPGGADLRPVSMSLYFLWFLAIVMIVVHGGSLISSERSRQTLDVLLTTPMSGRELLRQKLHGVWRLFRVLSVPFLTIFLFETWWNQAATYRWAYLPLELLALAIYLPLIAWIALAVGLRVRSQIKAVLTALALIGGWLLVPALFQTAWTDLLGVRSQAGLRYILLLNPSVLIPGFESLGELVMAPPGSKHPGPPAPAWPAFAANLLLHGWVLYTLRRRCLGHADRLLGRLTDEHEFPANQLHAEPAELPVEQLAT
jgi:ABC-type transport system involved in multi-copper enzyme maturation permease subunit